MIRQVAAFGMGTIIWVPMCLWAQVPSPALLDTDGDGQPDTQEVIAGTDPLDAGDYFAVRHICCDPISGQPAILWQSVTGRLYSVRVMSDEGHQEWSTVPGRVGMPGTGSEMGCALPVLTSTGCYRVDVQLGDLPPGMVLVPAGSFEMGDPYQEGGSDELPLHPVYVSDFYMDQYMVTKARWDEVASWAAAHAYDIEPATGAGKASTHPAQDVNWYECVKWCNARSEMEGRAPAYYTSSAKDNVYRTGEVDVPSHWVDWGSGYRLPTEVEWEKAARGGMSGQRFPWGSGIDHSDANYYANGSAYPYDTSPYTSYTYHPDFDEGGHPYTSPVGRLVPNGYGLYDMAGNVWERCWDWYGSSAYGLSQGPDPRGPTWGLHRVMRGGAWFNRAYFCRVAYRSCGGPENNREYLGFRVVLPP